MKKLIFALGIMIFSTLAIANPVISTGDFGYSAISITSMDGFTGKASQPTVVSYDEVDSYVDKSIRNLQISYKIFPGSRETKAGVGLFETGTQSWLARSGSQYAKLLYEVGWRN